MSTTFDRNNFHKNTFCVFRATAIPRRKPDFVSRSGSRYWFSDEGVTRHSNHWGRAAKCKWRLVLSEVSSREKTGFAKWNDFMRDNEFERLYFISIQHGIANYFHKDSGDYRGELLRTASETVKRLRQVRTFLENFEPDDGRDSAILELLVSTDKPMWQIHAAVSHI